VTTAIIGVKQTAHILKDSADRKIIISFVRATERRDGLDGVFGAVIQDWTG
jgi:hypothetical protein